MKKLRPARMRKSKRGKVHVGRPFAIRGWKLPCTWLLIGRRGSGEAFRRSFTSRRTYEEAQKAAYEMLDFGWESVAIVEKEQLFPRRP
jgi:hypothetical protein